ncbi:hypothetical protein ACA910_019640 [Epithemia clementina (nom. ined.)]
MYSNYTDMSTENSEHKQYTTSEKCIHQQEENSALYTQENASDKETKNSTFKKTKKNIKYMQNSLNNDTANTWKQNEFDEGDDKVSAMTLQAEHYDMHDSQRTYLPAFKNVPTYLQEMAWASHMRILFLKVIHVQENVRRCREQLQMYKRVINLYRLMKMHDAELPDVNQPRVLNADNMKVLAMYNEWQRQSYLCLMVRILTKLRNQLHQTEPKRRTNQLLRKQTTKTTQQEDQRWR